MKTNFQLEILTLSNTEVGDAGVEKACLENNLQELWLDHNRITGNGVIDIAKALLYDHKLTTLSLNSNPLDMKAIRSFQMILKDSNLKVLNFSLPAIENQPENIPSDVKQELVNLMCESYSVACALSIGSLTSRISVIAKIQYPNYLKEQKAQQKMQEKEKSIPETWGGMVNSEKLYQYLLKKHS